MGDGNAGIVVGLEGGFMCAYSFSVDVHCHVNVAERPAGPDLPPREARYEVGVRIADLASGQRDRSLVDTMKTSLREPKPSKLHLAAMRAVLSRLELSVQYFV